MLAFDWEWWLTTIPVRLDWLPGLELYVYVYIARLNVLLLFAAALNGGAIIALLLLRRAGVEITFGDH